jgi:membrane protein DedA with SNARE-associated domain
VIEALIARWGYLAVGVGTFLEGETVLIASSALAHRGLLSLPWVMIVAFVGSVSGDQFWFHIGRRFGAKIIRRRERWRRHSERVQRQLRRFGWVFVLGFRFVYGIRTVTPVFLGTTGYPSGRFLILNAIGGAIWAASFGTLGWALGASLELVISRTARIEEIVAATLVVVVAAWLVGRRFFRRSRTEPPSQTTEGDG